MPHIQEYPKYKFHPDKASVLVKTKEEEDKLGADWTNSPKDFPQVSEPNCEDPYSEDETEIIRENGEEIVKKSRSKKEK
jgi:hypothetical protein